MRWAVLLLFFLSVPLHAQVVEVNGGSSTLYQASGAAVLFHFPDSTLYTSIGDANGHIALGFAETRQWHGWDATFGDSMFSASAGGTGLGIMARGVSLTRHSKSSGLTLFVGATGTSYATPYFVSGPVQHFGAGLLYSRKFSRGLEFDSLEAVSGPMRTAVESLGGHWRIVKLVVSGGLLQNAHYWNAQLDLQPVKWASASIARTSYSFATVNTAGASLQAGLLNFHAAAYSSGTVAGQSVGASTHIDFVDLRVDAFHSQYGSNTTGSVGERLGRHWRVDQYVSESAGRWSFDFGGGYTSNLFTVNVGYQTYFMPLYVDRSPFQCALAASISFRLPHDTAVTVQTNVSPAGKVQYAAYGGTFLDGNLEEREPTHREVRSGFMIRGTVVDAAGMPVTGAAVTVGNQIAYTDSDGSFFVRVKRNRPALVHVDLDAFAAPGTWTVLNCPATAQPDIPLQITVKRD